MGLFRLSLMRDLSSDRTPVIRPDCEIPRKPGLMGSNDKPVLEKVVTFDGGACPGRPCVIHADRVIQPQNSVLKWPRKTVAYISLECWRP